MQNQRIEHLEQITSSRGVNLHFLTTTDPLSRVCQDGYWDRFTERGLRRNDKVMVSANVNATDAEHAWFVIVEPDEKRLVKAKLWLTGSEALL